MVGRRLPVLEDGCMTVPEDPGDYCGPTTSLTGGILAVFFLKPGARDEDALPVLRSLQHVTSPPHTFRECGDGSLEVRESIADHAVGSSESDGWHGYLDCGHVWRQV